MLEEESWTTKEFMQYFRLKDLETSVKKYDFKWGHFQKVFS